MNPRTLACCAVLAGVVCGAAAIPAFADGDDDRMRDLEEKLRRYAAEQERMRQEIDALRAARGEPTQESLRDAVATYLRESGQGDDPGTYVGPAGVRRPAGSLDIGGYFSTVYRSSDLPDERGSFVDMRLVPQVHADITENIEFDTEVEIEHGGVGGFADGEIVVEYAELSFAFSPQFVFKAGTLLVPFGHFNLNHDDPMNELSSRPRVARYVVPSAFDLPGIGAEGFLELGEETVLTYDVALTNGFRDAISSSSGTRPARGLFEDDENHHKTVFARVALIPTVPGFDAFSIAVSGASGRLGTDGGGEHSIRGLGADLQWMSGPWEFMGEYDEFTIRRASGTAPPVDPVTGDPGPVRGLAGYYLQLLHRLRGGLLRAPAFARDDASLGLVVRYDHVDLNDRIRGASPQDDEDAWSFGLSYRPTAKTVIKVEYRWANSPWPGEEGDDRDLFVVEFATYF